MPYTVQHSDTTKTAISIPDGTIDTSTSIGLIGKNASGYGRVLAEDLLHILENFASPIPPSNAIEGQLWYDTSNIDNKRLMVKSGASVNAWLPANGIYTQVQAPTSATVGTIWVDLTTQQLKMYNGVSWTIVGPNYSESLQTGPVVESLLGDDGEYYFVVKNYVNGEVVSILANNAFVPTVAMVGFTKIYPGLNVSANCEVHGVTNDAKSINVDGETVASSDVFRKDVDQTVNAKVIINSNDGIAIGGNLESTVKLQKVGRNGVLINTADRSKIFISVKQGTNVASIITVDGNTAKVGINKTEPTETLDIVGSLKTTGTATVNQLQVATSAEITDLTVSGTATLSGLVIPENSVITVGALNPADGVESSKALGNSNAKWSSIWVDTIHVTDTIHGIVDVSTKLASTTRFSITGQVKTIANVEFDGQTGGIIKSFSTVLDSSAIKSQAAVTSATGTSELIVADTSGLKRISKTNFLKDLVPPGSIIMWPSNQELAPSGWLMCDGGQYSISDNRYTSLYSVIGTAYGADDYNVPSYFCVPNMEPIVDRNGTAINYIIKL